MSAARIPSMARQHGAVEPARNAQAPGADRALGFLVAVGLGCAAAMALLHWVELEGLTGPAAAVGAALPVGHGRARTWLQRLRLRARLWLALYNLRVMQADIACMRSDLEALPGHIAYLERHAAARMARVQRLEEALR